MQILDRIASNVDFHSSSWCFYQDKKISLSEIRKKALRLAVLLRQYGITPGLEERVLLVLPRSPQLVVSHLATFWAGGVIVPVDPKIPETRMRELILDAQPKVAIVYDEKWSQLLKEDCTVITIDDQLHLEDVSNEIDEFQCKRSEDELGFIIYTSGTTGKPKGVMLELRSINALLSWHIREFNLQSQDCISLTASVSFDASMWEIWCALVSNASIYIATDDERLDPVLLQKMWIKYGVTHSFVATPLAHQLIDLSWEGLPVKLRYLLTGGDRLTKRPAKHLPFQLVNAYGPTEGCVLATAGVVEPETDVNKGIAPSIGKPLPYVRTYILNDEMQPIAQGERGKLWIGGEGLARGYLNLDDLTLEKFKPNPFCDDPNERIYNTGDIVSENEDGSLNYHGRDDFQVKIDGVRVELAEVESVMCSHPEISQALAMVIQMPSSQTSRLVCSVIPRDGNNPSVEQLRSYVELKLPRYMVPVQILVHQEFPLTTNGKVDRKRLEEMQLRAFLNNFQREDGELKNIAHPGLRWMIKTWEEVLEQRVGPNSDFFALGGTSLLAAKIAARISKHFHKDCRASHVLRCRTPENLLKELELAEHLAVNQSLSQIDQEGWYATTPIQQSLWYLWKTNPDHPFYNIGATFVLNNRINAERLKRAVLNVLSEEKSLRTRFRQNPETANIEQKIENLDTKKLAAQVDFRQQEASSVDEALRQIEEVYRQPFDLEKGWLFRCVYLPVRGEKSVFHLCMHHIIVDGLSINILLERIAQVYEQDQAIIQDSTDFRRYVSWHKKRSTEKKLKEFWTKRVENINLCSFIIDQENNYQRFAGRIYPCQSRQGLGNLLDAYCRKEKVSRFAVLLAAWSVILSQFCRQENITVGVPFHGRTHPDFENQVGMFVNMLPAQIYLDQKSSFTELVKQVMKEIDQIMEYGDLSTLDMARLVKHKSHDDYGFINTTFSEKLTLKFPLSNITTTFVELDTGGAKFHLSGFLGKVDDRIEGHIEYATSVFDESTIESLVDTYFCFLENALKNSTSSWMESIPVGHELIPDVKELNLLLKDSLTLHQLFERAAKSYAKQPALSFEGEVWSYEELKKRSDQLAYSLWKQGIDQGDLVPLIMDRSHHVIEAILAILKIGAVYVPLDPENPVERNRSILEKIQPKIVLVDTTEAIPSGPWRIHDMKKLGSNALSEIQLPAIDVKVTDPAYLLFTSGSTGEPKGVLCPHLGAALRIQWQIEKQHLNPGDKVLFKTPYTFDVSIWEMFYPLSVGAQLVIAPPNLHKDPLGLARLIETNQIRLCHFVPTMLNLFLDAVEANPKLDLSSLRIIHSSGEELTFSLAQRLLKNLPQVTLLNLYGPTETGIEVTCFTFDHSKSYVNLGSVLPYVTAKVVDKNGRIVPNGFPGELVIGGPCLALKYYQNEEATARAFFNEETNEGQKRYYKTGDLVRLRKDGTLDYLGRIDDQIKVRGVRVELGEIESKVLEIEGIQDTAVALGKTKKADALVCFYVLAKDREHVPDAKTIKQILSEKIPISFIPSVYVPVRVLPLTRSGKKDRKRLSKMASEVLLQTQKINDIGPRTPMEKKIAHIWCKVMNLERVGINQNFFELGGDSVKSLQIIHLLLNEGLKLTPRDFFTYPTVEEQAHYLEKKKNSISMSRVEKSAEVDKEDSVLPLTPLQSVMLVETLKNPESEAYWQILAYALPNFLSHDLIKKAWQKTVEENPALRMQLVLGNRQQPGQIIQQDIDVEVTFVTWEEVHLQSSSLEKWCQDQLDELKKKRLKTLQRAYCIWDEYGEKETVFVWIHHHIVIDGWSLSQCLNSFFRQLVSNGEAEIVERPSVRKYFQWLEETNAKESAKSFWRQQLKGIEPAQTLHFEKAGAQANVQSPVYRTKDMVLSQRAAHTLSAFCQRWRLTPPSVITYLWALILRQYQENSEICVGLTLANRSHQFPNAQELSGMLINTLPVLIRPQEEESFVDGARSVLEKLLDISQHGHLSYAELLQEIGLPGLTELFKSTLIFQNFYGDLTFKSLPEVDWKPELLLAKGTTTDPLSLTLDVKDEWIGVRVGWDETRYSYKKVESLVRSLNYWLERLDELSEQTTVEISLVTDEEWQLLAEALEADLNMEKQHGWCLGKYLAKYEQMIAVVDEHKKLTYGELTQRALRLAHKLQSEFHISPGDSVVFIGKRSVESVIAICAAWLLEASWCSVDINFPEERKQKIIQVLSPKAVVDLNQAWEWSNSSFSDNHLDLISSTLKPEQIAYYISTSGSTGDPKLVALTAGGISQVVESWKTYYGFDRPQNVLQVGSWTSDVFLGDFLKTLSTGGTLVICPDEKKIDIDYLIELINTWEITLFESTPALVGAVLRRIKEKNITPKSLTTLIVGSDVFRIEELKQMQQCLWNGVTLYNGYGLSECTIESLVLPCHVHQNVDSRSGLCPIGSPLPGTKVRIVDKSGKDLPPGAVGMLHIGGAQVAKGYLVSNGVVSNTFYEQNGTRYFNTGDLVRLNEEGIIEFYGRSDQQVKVRGYRVELGEIENALLGINGVKEAATFTAGKTGKLELVAFVSPANGDEEQLKKELSQLLPEYAIPRRIILLEKLPRNANGKIDRITLKQEAEKVLNKIEFHSDRDAMSDEDVKYRLMRIWEELLCRPIKMNRSFFDQGGHSLLALQLYERMKEEFPEDEFEIADLFRYPSVVAMADYLQEKRALRSREDLGRKNLSKNSKQLSQLEILQKVQKGELSPDEALKLLS